MGGYRCIHVAAGDGALFQQPLAFFRSAFGYVQVSLGLIHVQLRFLDILGNSRLCRGRVGCLRLG